MVRIHKMVLGVLLLSLFGTGCEKDYISKDVLREQLNDSELFLKSVDNLTAIQVHDIFSPPVASRVYVYPCVAAYEAMCPGYTDYESFAGRLDGLLPLDIEVDTTKVSYELAAIYTFNEVGKTLIFSEEKMTTWQENIDSTLNSWQVNPKVIEGSRQYATQVAKHILEWASKDNYNQTRSMPKFSVMNKTERWKPTPPAYMEGIEPNWNQIRTMVLETADQFKPAPPPPFSLEEGSEFYKLVKEVYDVGNALSEEERLIASFWDCNPFVMNQTGHVMFASKKITPGGHWMGITGIACRKAKTSLMETSRVHTLVSIALFDAFISCWDEKYRSNLVRPETVINEAIDDDWLPTLQTPPFPEHTSGHSVISTAAGLMLTALFGDGFSFNDTVEVKYGLPERQFSSFEEAYREAAISRLYGGIHYRPAIEDGVAQGKRVGGYIIEELVK